MEPVAILSKLGIEPVAMLGIEPVAIHSKLGIGACYDTFKAWYFAISLKIGIENVATRFKLGMSLLRYVSSWVLRLLYISTHYCFHSTDFCTSTACTSTIPVHNVGALMCVSSSCVHTVEQLCCN